MSETIRFFADSTVRRVFQLRWRLLLFVLNTSTTSIDGMTTSKDVSGKPSAKYANDCPGESSHPKFLRMPRIYSAAESKTRTARAIQRIQMSIAMAQNGILVILHQDSSYSSTCRNLLLRANDDDDDTVHDNKQRDEEKKVVDLTPVSKNVDSIALGTDWLQCIPIYPKAPTAMLTTPIRGKGQLLISIGTFCKFSNLWMKDSMIKTLDEAHDTNNFIAITKSSIMLPADNNQQHIVHGAHAEQVVQAVTEALSYREEWSGKQLKWGHAPGSKTLVLPWALSHLPQEDVTGINWSCNLRIPTGALPQPLSPYKMSPSDTALDILVQYIQFQNEVKMAMGSSFPVSNYFDAGLHCSVLQTSTVRKGISLLTDRDGLAMNRDASIGHTLSKMSQLMSVDPFKSSKGIYNFWVGDGASRLNGGAELAFSFLDRGEVARGSRSFTTLFTLIDEAWGIEDFLIQKATEYHKLYDRGFYHLLAQHPHVTLCHGAAELSTVICDLTKQQEQYLQDIDADGQFQMVLVTNMNIDMPKAMLPNVAGEGQEVPEISFLRATLGAFAKGCQNRIPIYGCSAFEFIQLLNVFLESTPEGRTKYQYITAMADIQASHLCGFDHADGKCVMFLNDIFGINSLGESLRMNQSGFGDQRRQVMLFVWHPSFTDTRDNFTFHRHPMVWPSVSNVLAKFYVCKEEDAAFIDFDGTLDTVPDIEKAIAAKTPLILINMLPKHVRTQRRPTGQKSD